VTAQSTYYVPAAMGSHDLKVGFEYLLDIASTPSTDGRARFSTRDLMGNSAEIRFSDVARIRPSATPGEDRTIATSATPATRRTAGIRTTG
jgi:hypothetical protein